VKSLKTQRSIQTSNILSSRSSQAILARLRAAQPQTPALPTSTTPLEDNNPLHQAVLDLSQKQLAHNQECLYRACTGITTFKVQDPDPFAVDKGKVLGIRIEAFTNGKFIRPYYVFLNKPYADSRIMRVHRHTVPPCIPLAALAAKYLPTPAAGLDDVPKVRNQDLPRFVRCLRREIASYHNRIAAIAGMRKAFGLDVKRGRNKGKGRELVIRDISAADAEAKQIRFEWVDGRIGRAVVDGKGEIQKCVIIGEDGRDRDMERRILGGNRTIDEMAERMGMGIKI
jgi:central kinetochore subunit Mal2/MCM21